MFSVISTLWNFFSSGAFKWVIVIITFTTLLFLYFSSRIDNANLNTVIATQEANINTLNANIVHLKSLNKQYSQALSNKDNETMKMNDLLKKCYQANDEHQTHLDQIQEIMNTPTPSQEETIEEVKEYTPVTPYQTKRGLQFVNEQMSRITPVS